MILELFSILVLTVPIIWELWDDRNGDEHVKNDDWILRGLLMVLGSIIVALINPNRNFIQAFFLSFAMFAALFPYLINIVHYKRGVTSDKKWWSHLSKKAIPDKWLYFLPWWTIAILYLIILGMATKLYICWDSLKAWDGCR